MTKGMTKGRIRRMAWPICIGLGVFCSTVLLKIATPSSFTSAETSVFDIYQRAWPRPYVDAGVRILDIDDESLSRIGQWPWSRDRLADLTLQLRDMGAAAIVYDFVFAEPDRTSPANLAKSLLDRPDAKPLIDHLGSLPDHDATFASAVAASPVVLSSGLVARGNSVSPQIKAPIATLGASTADSLPLFNGAVINLPILEAAASGLATFSFAGETDNIVRTIPIASRLGNKIIPSLELEALRVATGAHSIALRRDDLGLFAGGRMLRAKVGPTMLRAEIDGAYRLRFSGRESTRAVPAWQVLAGDPTAAAAIQGHIVLIGTSAAGLSDLRATPLDPYEPGVEIHAEALEQMLLGITLVRPDGVLFLELGLAILSALILISLASAIPFSLLVSGLVAFIAVTIGGSIWAFLNEGLLIDPIAILFSPVLAAIATAGARYILFERDAKRLKAAFGQYLSPTLVERLSTNSGELRLGGETRRISCLFTDLEDFTQFSERAEAETLVSVINAYLGGLCEVAADQGGTIVKMIGDAVHVMFNAPLDMPDHADRAVACALAMQAFATEFAIRTNADGIRFGATRIGVNTGSAVVGNFGGNRRFDYSAYGDTVNVAARLEALNKTLGTSVCVSEATMLEATRFAYRTKGSVMLKGKSEACEVFEPLCLLEDISKWKEDDAVAASSAA